MNPAVMAGRSGAGEGSPPTADQPPEFYGEFDRRPRARQSLGLVGVEQMIGNPVTEHEVELPCQVCRVAQTRAHTLAGEWRHEVGSIAG
jgi:hypothetical protein